MKRYKRILAGLLAGVALASCSDDKLVFDVKKPVSLEEFEYLKNYDVLKSYVSTSSPNFKLGAGVSVSEFNKRATEYSMITSNFNEVVAGWEMKHGAVVQADGTLNLTNVAAFISTAKEAGLDVYGHTLTWHANQNAAYLNKLIAPVIIPGGSPAWEEILVLDFETDVATNYSVKETGIPSFVEPGASGTGRALKIENESVRSAGHDVQLFVDFAATGAVKGDKFKLSMKVKADQANTISTQGHDQNGYKDWATFGYPSITTSWTEYVTEVEITDARVGIKRITFDLGSTATNFYFDDIVVSKWNESGGPGEPYLEESIITNSTFEAGDGGWGGWGQGTKGVTPNGEGADGVGKAFSFTNSSLTKDYWDTQIAYDFATPLIQGSKYVMKLKIKGSQEGVIKPELQSSSSYQSNGFGDVAVTTSWQELTFNTIATAADRNRFIISYGHYVGTVYIDDITIQRENPNEGGSQTIEKTPEEKYEIIYGELERWIAGIMEVSKDHVKAWDVVNEPMDDGSPFELKSGVGKELKADEFFWQDYLGYDYAVEAFKLAKQYGNSDDKLFINDYNLEYNLDKCRGIIAYVEHIEENGGRVDGIGTQMHIHTGSDRGKITQMLELLAETGKLIKISELDIGIEGGVKTQNATSEQLRAQADMYKFVIEEYVRLIPVSQQYGITIWSPKDSPASSSWRAGEPIGLWTEGYVRKYAYGAVADALK
jgi:endo-1,4-beta-xylanase